MQYEFLTLIFRDRSIIICLQNEQKRFLYSSADSVFRSNVLFGRYLVHNIAKCIDLYLFVTSYSYTLVEYITSLFLDIEVSFFICLAQEKGIQESDFF